LTGVNLINLFWPV